MAWIRIIWYFKKDLRSNRNAEYLKTYLHVVSKTICNTVSTFLKLKFFIKHKNNAFVIAKKCRPAFTFTVESSIGEKLHSTKCSSTSPSYYTGGVFFVTHFFFNLNMLNTKNILYNKTCKMGSHKTGKFPF